MEQDDRSPNAFARAAEVGANTRFRWFRQEGRELSEAPLTALAVYLELPVEVAGQEARERLPAACRRRMKMSRFRRWNCRAGRVASPV
jgi:hypothetical protein